ncbi:MAG: hypothetical protein PHU06_13555 [Gallionella sp.]|nr:hypothetical protein [Gallionella sp.]MDD4959932.1 hypothetical protein [Gallionella sp.]
MIGSADALAWAQLADKTAPLVVANALEAQQTEFQPVSKMLRISCLKPIFHLQPVVHHKIQHIACSQSELLSKRNGSDFTIWVWGAMVLHEYI